VVGAVLLNTVLVFLMFITIVLLPFGFYRQVQWFLLPPCGDSGWRRHRAARKVSRNAIKGDWIRTFGMSAVISIISGLPGPLIGMGLVLTNRVSLEAAGIVSSVVFAIVYPIAIIASTLYYRGGRRTRPHAWPRAWPPPRARKSAASSSSGRMRKQHPLPTRLPIPVPNQPERGKNRED
jgi:hypothetical protein